MNKETKQEARRSQMRAHSLQRKFNRQDARRKLRCFWTWPFGHVWDPVDHDDGMYELYCCRFCPAKKYPVTD